MKLSPGADGGRRGAIGLVCLVILVLAAAAAFFFHQPEERAAWRPGLPLARERVKIGIIYLTDVTGETSGYTYAHDLGLRETQKAIGLRDDQIIRKIEVSDTDSNATAHAMRECIAEGANIIIATAQGYAGACEKLAEEYPNVVFAQLYANLRNDTNLTNYFGRVYQARYLSGLIAGLRTRTNKIGYVAAMGKDNSQVTSGLSAFALGVERVNRTAGIYAKITHRWVYPDGEFEAANSMIEAGCDVIAQHCDTPSPQLAAEKAGVWGIGYNSDMRNDADIVITSVLWNWNVYYSRLVRSVIDGTFTTEPYFGDLNEGLADLSPFNEHLMPAGAAEIVAAERRRIESGELGVFEGLMETNDGRTVGREGHRLSDAEILGGLNWYYRNVVEIQ